MANKTDKILNSFKPRVQTGMNNSNFVLPNRSGSEDYHALKTGYGSMWNNNTNTTVTITASSTITRIPSGFTVGYLNNCTFQNNREILIRKKGVYSINWSLSFSTPTANQEAEASVMINNIKDTQSTAHRKLAAANDLGNMGGCCLASLNVGDVVSLGIQNNSSTADFVVNHGNMTLSKVN